jgi:hypothetical protein
MKFFMFPDLLLMVSTGQSPIPMPRMQLACHWRLRNMEVRFFANGANPVECLEHPGVVKTLSDFEKAGSRSIEEAIMHK